MRLTAFHATDGDCLLLSSGGKHVLIDGGRTASFDKYTKPALAAIREQGERLDVVYVSHIDDDHITGVLRLIEDTVEWRAFEFARTVDPDTEPPAFQPPDIGEVWHNGLFVLVGDQLAPQVQPVLATTAMVLAGSSDREIRDLASQLDDLATGEKASMELSRRLSPEQLGIPLNPRTGGKLMKRAASGAKQAGEEIDIGTMKFLLLGPSDDDIDRLRKSWGEWLKHNKAALKKLQSSMLADEQRLGALDPGFVANPIETELGDGLKTITEANLASLMFLVEEAGKMILLTGDGVSSEILEGLKRHGKLKQGRLHVDVLKVQHHGAEGNVTKELVNAVTADHYVFCGNGAHSNPEVSVVEGFARQRILLNKTAPFKFWFTSSSETPDTTSKQERRKHMAELEELVASLQEEPELDGRFTAEFIPGGSFSIEL
jgi:hypothetical protein